MARAKHRDFLDIPDAKFGKFFENLLACVTKKTAGGQNAAWAHIPPAALAGLGAAFAAWNTSYGKMIGPHTPVDTREKNDTRKAVEKEIRAFHNTYLRFHPAVTSEDKKAMGLHVADTVRSPVPVPGMRCLVTGLRNLRGYRVEIRFQNEATPHSKAIPYGMNGALLNYTWGPEKVWDQALLKEGVLMTQTPYVLGLPQEAEGKFLSLACRWQNYKGELGPWSDILHIVVS